MKRLLLAAAVALTVSPALAVTMNPQQAISQAKAAVLRQLKDPYSARFLSVQVLGMDGLSMVCGYVNAKNSYGGYVGARQFAYDTATDFAMLQETDDQIDLIHLCKR